MNIMYTEKEVRQIALCCMGFMAGQFEEINKSIIPDSAWKVEPNHIRDKAIGYLDKVMNEIKANKSNG